MFQSHHKAGKFSGPSYQAGKGKQKQVKRSDTRQHEMIERLECRQLLSSTFPTTVTMAPIVRAVASETNVGTVGRAWLQFKRTGPTDQAMNVYYQVKKNSTATAGSDYVPLPGWVTIPAGRDFVNVALQPIDDGAVESPEVLVVELGKGKYNYTATQSRLYIADNDVAAPTVTDPAPETGSGSDGDNDVTAPVDTRPSVQIGSGDDLFDDHISFGFTLSRTGPTTEPLVVHLSWNDALKGIAFNNPLPTTITIAAGQHYADFNRTATGATEAYQQLTATIVESADYQYQVGEKASASVKLSLSPTLVISADNPEGSEAGDVLSFTVTRRGNFDWTGYATIRYTGATGDVLNLPTTVEFFQKSNSTTINLHVIDDDIIEENETITVWLVPEGPFLIEGDDHVVLTVRDNDSNQPVVTIRSEDKSASEDGDPASFTISRTGSTANDLVVRLAYDYPEVDQWRGGYPPTVTIPAGQSSITVPILAIDDDVYEPHGSLRIYIANSPDYIKGDAFSQYMWFDIIDNDAPHTRKTGHWLDDRYDYRIMISLTTGANAGTDQVFITNVNLLKNTGYESPGEVNFDSLRVVEFGANGEIIDADVPFAWEPTHLGSTDLLHADIQLRILATGTTEANTTRKYFVYYAKGGEFTPIAFDERAANATKGALGKVEIGLGREFRYAG